MQRLVSDSGSVCYAYLCTWEGIATWEAREISNFRERVVTTSADGRNVLLDGIEVRLEDVGACLLRRIQDTEASLDRLLFGGYRTTFPEVCLKSVHDSQAEGALGYTFLTEQANRATFGPLQDRLSEVVSGSPELFERFFDPATSRVRKTAAQGYVHDTYKFLEELATLLVVTTGPPMRMTELFSALWRNLWFGLRSFLVDRGCLVLVLDYNKTQTNTARRRPIIRMPLPRVAQLVVQYLLHVRPFLVFLLQSLEKDEAADFAANFVFVAPGGLMTTTDVTRVLGRWTVPPVAQGGLGGLLNVQMWRQYFPVAFRNNAEWVLKRMGPIMRGKMTMEEAMGHDEETGHDHYGKNQHTIPRLYPKTKEAFIAVCVVWQVLMKLLGADEVPEFLEARADVLQLASGSTNTLSLPGYLPEGSDLADRLGRVEQGLAQLEAEAAAAHTSMMRTVRDTGMEIVGAVHAAGSLTGLGTRPAGGTLTVAQLRAVWELSGTDAQGGLSTLQSDVVSSVMDPAGSTADVLVVTPTGSGKTHMFVVIAKMLQIEDRSRSAAQPGGGTGSQVMVVAVPLRRLVPEVVARFASEGVLAVAYSADLAIEDTAGVVAVVLVFESLLTERCKDLLSELCVRRRLRVLAVDEVHEMLHALRYRRQLSGFCESEALNYPVSKLLASATMPPAWSADLVRDLGSSSVREFREETILPQHSYRATRVPEGITLADGFEGVYRHYRDGLPCGKRMMIFCKSVASVKDIAERLGCLPTLYSEQAVDETDANLRWWGAREPVMVATSVAGTGFDTRDVSVVLFYGYPWDLIDLIQQGGRGGRDGRYSVIHVVYHAKEASSFGSSTAASKAGFERDLVTWSETWQCRRTHLSRVMDSKDRCCFSQAGQHLCDHCWGLVMNDGRTPPQDPKALAAREVPAAFPPIQVQWADGVQPPVGSLFVERDRRLMQPSLIRLWQYAKNKEAKQQLTSRLSKLKDALGWIQSAGPLFCFACVASRRHDAWSHSFSDCPDVFRLDRTEGERKRAGEARTQLSKFVTLCKAQERFGHCKTCRMPTVRGSLLPPQCSLQNSDRATPEHMRSE